MSRNSSLDLMSALEAFKASNPDLPEGETIAEEPDVKDADRKSFRLDIILEKKGRAGKQATIIAGFEDMTGDDIQSVASDIKRRLGTGGSARGGEILIHCDRRKDVLKILIDMGYKASII